MVSYVSSSLGISQDVAKKKVKAIINARIKNPVVKHFQRGDNGDRTVENTPLLQYIKSNVDSGGIMTPTFTTYLHPSQKRSMLSEFIFDNVAMRNKAKKLAKQAKAQEKMEEFEHYNGEQNNKKIWNNSMSGAFGQEGSILFNPTAHSSLTSMTRIVASLANANNEKMITGNRHYLSEIDTLNNCIYIAAKCDQATIGHVLSMFNLRVPTVDDTLKIIFRSSDIYWTDAKFVATVLRPYLETLSPEQLAAICYTGDLYHIKELNDSFTRKFLESLSQKVVSDDKSPDVVTKLLKIEEDVRNFSQAIWFYEVKGYGTDYALMHEKGIASSLLSTCENILAVLSRYKELIQAFFVSDLMPPVVNKIRNMARRTVVISDTDSTCFALDSWVVWYSGEFVINAKNIAIAAGVAYITTQLIAHLLAMFSANINVEKKELHTLSMKNEFLWTVHLPTEVSKHYAALTVMKEGSVYKNPELELKGVHLKNSATPVDLIKDSSALVTRVLTAVHNNEKVNLTEIITGMVAIENMIEESLLVKHETLYFKKSKIKEKSAYANDEMLSPFQRHTFWVNVFEATYGEIAAPPYDVVKIPTIVDRKRILEEWISSLDPEISARLRTWVTAFKKDSLPTIYLSEDYVTSSGIPKEIVKIIDARRIILDLTKQHRMLLTSFGIALEGDRLIKEHFR
jgi:hypothetical protein